MAFRAILELFIVHLQLGLIQRKRGSGCRREATGMKMGRGESYSDIRKPAFFKVLLMKDFSLYLKIPPTFVKRFLKNAPEKANLLSPFGSIWEVEIKNKSKDLYLYGGWQDFAEEHCLQRTDLLLFTYEDNMHFSVTIFDRTACNQLPRLSTEPSLASNRKRIRTTPCLPKRDQMQHFEHASHQMKYCSQSEMCPKDVYNAPSHSTPSVTGLAGNYGGIKKKRGRPRKNLQNTEAIAQGISYSGEIEGMKKQTLEERPHLTPCKMSETTINSEVMKKPHLQRWPDVERISNLGACMKEPLSSLQAHTDTVGQNKDVQKEKRKRGRPPLPCPRVSGHVLHISEPPKRQGMHLRPHSYHTQYTQFYTTQDNKVEKKLHPPHRMPDMELSHLGVRKKEPLDNLRVTTNSDEKRKPGRPRKTLLLPPHSGKTRKCGRPRKTLLLPPENLHLLPRSYDTIRDRAAPEIVTQVSIEGNHTRESAAECGNYELSKEPPLPRGQSHMEEPDIFLAFEKKISTKVDS